MNHSGRVRSRHWDRTLLLARPIQRPFTFGLRQLEDVSQQSLLSRREFLLAAIEDRMGGGNSRREINLVVELAMPDAAE